MGHLRLTIGYLKATVVHIRVTEGHLKVTIGNFFSELHPKVRPTCRKLEMKHKFIFFQHDIFQRRLNCCCTRVKNWAALKPKKSGEAPGDAPPRTALFSTVQPGPALAATPTAESSQILTYT